MNKHKNKIAFGLLILYLCFSFYKLGVNSFWYDECFSIELGDESIEEIINYSLYKDTNPPLYLIIVHYWINIFGNSELALRSISAISSSLAFAIFFLFSLRFFNWQTAIFSTIFFFTSNELFYYSQEGRTYGLILLFTVLSNYAFISLVQKPNWISAIFLGLFNITIFYLHTLGCFNVIGQLILVPILCYKGKNQESKSAVIPKSFLGFELKFIVTYFASWLVFFAIFWPWKNRILGILKEGGKGFWLQKPGFKEYKNVLFDFYNSESLFYVYVILIASLTLLLLISKKLREKSFNYKLLLIPIILGPIVFHANFFAASITPVFLKRYILFSLLSFILLLAYLISSIKLDFRLKMIGVLLLGGISFYNMKIPRDPFWDYNKVVDFIKEKISPNTFIYTDNPMIFAYYYNKKEAFQVSHDKRYSYLATQNIFTSANSEWPNSTNFSKYKDIYYIRSFDIYNDPEKLVEKTLKSKFEWIEDFQFLCTSISHYEKSVIDKNTLNEWKTKIIQNKEWFNQVELKAKERNVSIDSMVTADAVWAIQKFK